MVKFAVTVAVAALAFLDGVAADSVQILKTIKCDETKDFKMKKMDDGTAVMTLREDKSSDWKYEMEFPVGTMIDFKWGWKVQLNDTDASDHEIKQVSHGDCWVAKTTRPATGGGDDGDNGHDGDDNDDDEVPEPVPTIKCNETKGWRIKKMDNGTAIIRLPNDNTSVWKSEMELPLGTMIKIFGFEPVLLNGNEANKTIYMLSHEDCWITKNTGPAPGTAGAPSNVENSCSLMEKLWACREPGTWWSDNATTYTECASDKVDSFKDKYCSAIDCHDDDQMSKFVGRLWKSYGEQCTVEPEKMRGLRVAREDAIICREGIRKDGDCQVADFYCKGSNGPVPIIRKHDAIMLMDPKCFPGGGTLLVARANGKKVHSRSVKYGETFEIDGEWDNFFDLLATYQNLKRLKLLQNTRDRRKIIKVLEEKIFHIALTFWFQARWSRPAPDQFLPRRVVFQLIESTMRDLKKQKEAANKNGDEKKVREISRKLNALDDLITRSRLARPNTGRRLNTGSTASAHTPTRNNNQFKVPDEILKKLGELEYDPYFVQHDRVRDIDRTELKKAMSAEIQSLTSNKKQEPSSNKKQEPSNSGFNFNQGRYSPIASAHTPTRNNNQLKVPDEILKKLGELEYDPYYLQQGRVRDKN